MTEETRKEAWLRLKEEKKQKVELVTIDGYSQCVETSGDVIGAYMCFKETLISKLIIVVDDYKEKAELSIVIKKWKLREKTEKTERFLAKRGETRIACDYIIEHGERVAISVEYDDPNNKPKGVWVAANGRR